MDNSPAEAPDSADEAAGQEHFAHEMERLTNDFQSRLISANLRTEAVRAGMIDLDGLKLVNLSNAQLGTDDKVVGGRQIMDELRRNKPWLFGLSSSSSVAAAPVSQVLRQKTALEMTDEEYLTARAALIRRR